MTKDELFAIRDLMREELVLAENRIMNQVDERIKAVQSETMKGASVLMDTQFMGQFKLLAEGQDAILQKMPSEDDLNMIDDRLQEHDDEIRVLRRDVNELKRA